MSAALTVPSGDTGLEDEGLGHGGCGRRDDDSGGKDSLNEDWFPGRRQTSTTGRHSRRTWRFKTASETPSVAPPGSACTMEEGSDGGRSAAFFCCCSVGSSISTCALLLCIKFSKK